MTSFLLCAMLAAGAAPVPADNIAPAPRLVKPDISLIVVEWVAGTERKRGRGVRIGFRNGLALPREIVCETEAVSPADGNQIVSDRFLVTGCAGVIDLRDGKVLNDTRDGEVMHVGKTKIIYTVDKKTRDDGVFECEYATGKVTRLEATPAKPWYRELGPLITTSPDNTKAVEWRDEDELILHREGGKPRSLGKGFKMPRDPKEKVDPRVDEWRFLPVLWLDEKRFLTQRDQGKLVTVDLVGKVTEVITVRNAPKFGQASLSFARDESGAIFYSIDGTHFRIDLAKQTATKAEWEPLAHGFDVSWVPDKRGYAIRYKGKEIGRRQCFSFAVAIAPGFFAASEYELDDQIVKFRNRVVVWSAESGGWQTLEFDSLDMWSAVGWIK